MQGKVKGRGGGSAQAAKQQQRPSPHASNVKILHQIDANTTPISTSARPVATTGSMGQLFTVYENNWNCKDCGQENYPTRNRCFRCKKSRPDNSHDYIMNPALEAMQRGEEIHWQEAIDPNSYQVYYYNKTTGVTQWERPEELGPAPMATGWFGRGSTAGSSKYIELNALYLSRPARKQKEYIDPKKFMTEGQNDYNIWYGKYQQERDWGANKEKAADRCVLDTDAGYTLADTASAKSSRREKRHFCVHFAQGGCAKGHECAYFHRTPLPEDDARVSEMVDCFGRQRHRDHSDDMNGVGSFMKPSRTLFVGNLLKHKYDTPKLLEEALWRHFGVWGELESLNYIQRLSIAFPRYRLRTSAEFAKEAMSQQSLDGDEILSIRWAHDDPNPMAQEAINRADRDALAALMQAKGISIAQAPFEYPADYQLPTAKKARLDDGVEVPADLAYPDTDHQYASSTTVSASAQKTAGEEMSPEEYGKYIQQIYGISATPVAAATSSAEHEDQGEEEEEEEEEEKGWNEHIDASTGATFYYNAMTKESTWAVPADFKR